MKRFFCISVILVASILTTNAQKIESEKVFGGYKYTQNEKMLTLSDMQEIMKNNQEAYDLVSSAKKGQTWALILGTAGGALVGYPLGTAIGGGDPEWALAGVGAALIVATIPIASGVNKKTQKAVSLYNDVVSSTGYHFQPDFNLKINGTGLGISMSF